MEATDDCVLDERGRKWSESGIANRIADGLNVASTGEMIINLESP